MKEGRGKGKQVSWAILTIPTSTIGFIDRVMGFEGLSTWMGPGPPGMLTLHSTPEPQPQAFLVVNTLESGVHEVAPAALTLTLQTGQALDLGPICFGLICFGLQSS